MVQVGGVKGEGRLPLTCQHAARHDAPHRASTSGPTPAVLAFYHCGVQNVPWASCGRLAHEHNPGPDPSDGMFGSAALGLEPAFQWQHNKHGPKQTRRQRTTSRMGYTLVGRSTRFSMATPVPRAGTHAASVHLQANRGPRWEKHIPLSLPNLLGWGYTHHKYFGRLGFTCDT